MATRIFVVENERIIAKGIEKRLQGLGYVVAGSAGNGDAAVRGVLEQRPDLVLMDVHLGSGIDGIEAAALIRARLDVPIVFLTAFSDDATLQRAKLTGPFGYVLKPYEDKDIQTAIQIGLYRHKMDLQLRENEQWLAATLSSIGDAVLAIDDRGRVRFMNALAEQLTGWPQAEALGRDVCAVVRLVSERTREEVPNPALGALARAEPVALAPGTALIDRAGVERPIDDSAAPIRDASGRVAGAVLVFRDITERRRLEEHLRQAQKMEAIGRLAGGIAHDFNNIMTVISGFSEVLLGTELPVEERREYLRDIRDAGKRAAALTQQIMAFGRKQTLLPCVLDLNTVLRDMGAMVKRLLGPSVELVIEPAAELGRVKADPTQLGQVLLNLAANARDAMPGGGRLVLATGNAEPGAEPGRHAGAPAGRYVMLSVADTGTGMTDDVLARVFEPFFTTKGHGQGTGLGLAAVYGIVKQSGGHVEVSTAVGKGTTFRVYLPRLDDPSRGPASPELRPPGKGRETVLLVEDDETVRRMVRMILSQEGYAVLEAADGQQALEVAAGCGGPLHLLVTDLVIPHLTGREVAERLTARQPGLRVLFLSGYAEDVIAQQGVETTAANFLHKPFSIAELARKVREIIEQP
jgi:PAS domain S-box-containing protein